MDVVLVLEGDRYGALRLLRGAKNRFGSTEETGVLEMTGEGLRDVPDPARAFLGEGGGEAPGVAVAAILEGTRPILVEVQALVASARHRHAPARARGRARRTGSRCSSRCWPPVRPRPGQQGPLRQPRGGCHRQRAGSRPGGRAGPGLHGRDVALAPGTVACGEVSLLGELRPVRGLERRLREAARLGFRQAIVPAGDDSDRLGRPSRDPAVAPAGDRGATLARSTGAHRSGPVRYLRGRVRRTVALVASGDAPFRAIAGRQPRAHPGHRADRVQCRGIRLRPVRRPATCCSSCGWWPGSWPATRSCRTSRWSRRGASS